MNKITAIIVDDEPYAREGLRSLLNKDSDIDIIGEAENGEDAVELISRLKPDVVFLDIQMPGMDGFGVINEIRFDDLPIIVFVTAYDQYALKAFEANALDYLLKPFDDDRFFDMLEKVKSNHALKEKSITEERLLLLLDQVSKSKNAPTKSYPKRILVKDNSITKVINVSDIEHITAADYYITIHTTSDKYTIRDSMKSMEDKLNPDDFARIHRSTIININRIESLQLFGKDSYRVICCSGEKFDVSRAKLDELKKRLNN